VKIGFLGAGALGNALGSKRTQAGNDVRVQVSTDCRGIGSADRSCC
jgi:hypothetical protein